MESAPQPPSRPLSYLCFPPDCILLTRTADRMAERKVLSKYFPPDFDPSKIKRVKKDIHKQQVVRLMAPFSMACKSCKEYIYKGRKFNARKELVADQNYYGIKIFRFYIKCTRCSAEITFKTDPRNTDYEMEHGATRNYEPWKEPTSQDGVDDEDPLAYLAEEERIKELEAMGKDPSKEKNKNIDQDPLLALEERQKESKREMELLDQLQDLRSRNARLDKVDTNDLLDRLHNKRKRDQDGNEGLTAESLEELEALKAQQEDEQLVQRYFSKASDTDVTVKRSRFQSEPDINQLLSDRALALLKGSQKTSSSEASPPATKTPEQASTPAAPATTATSPKPKPAPPTKTNVAPPTTTDRTPSSATQAALKGMAAAKAKKKKNALGLVQKQAS
ncbi:unnamed protein product [Sympodiomycopsis kandeliae]